METGPVSIIFILKQIFFKINCGFNELLVQTSQLLKRKIQELNAPCRPTENILYLTIVYYAKMNIVNYSEFGQFTIVMSIVPYSRTMLDYGNF